MAFVIDFTLEVDAPAATVWDVITDLDAYSEWNPFVRACQSTLKPGDPMDMTVQIGKSTRDETEIMQTCDQGRGFAYAMQPPPLGALSSFRSHDIEPVDGDRCRYHSHFELKGWLAPVVKMFVGTKLQAGFKGMSEGIRDRAQALTKQRQPT